MKNVNNTLYIYISNELIKTSVNTEKIYNELIGYILAIIDGTSAENNIINPILLRKYLIMEAKFEKDEDYVNINTFNLGQKISLEVGAGIILKMVEEKIFKKELINLKPTSYIITLDTKNNKIITFCKK